MNNNIYKQVENHVTGLFETNKRPKLFFHTLEHTENIVQRAGEIADQYKLPENERLAVIIAAWFHDTGHLFGPAETHEEKSVELMTDFMKAQHSDDNLIKTIAGCILATKRAVEPSNRLEQIVCDADTYHLGTKDFKKTNKLVRKEISQDDENNLSKSDWDIKTLEFLEKHKYYTPYCIELLEKGKQENIERLRQKLVESSVSTEQSKLFGEQPKKNDPKMDKQSITLLSRGIQTMMRLASENHLRLSDMADGKANILISVNAIIISVVISVLMRKFETDPYLVIPTITFLVFSVVTIVLSILATRPKVTKGSFNKEDITNKKVNLLFFGNFHKMSLEDYHWAMTIMMRDADYLYGSLIKDVYYLGVVLGRKYKLLRIAYNIFMVGIIVSVLAFTVAVFTKSPSSTTTIIQNPTTTPL
jgi:predicted metal-dependent HD superfamily phosphohydrolase